MVILTILAGFALIVLGISTTVSAIAASMWGERSRLREVLLSLLGVIFMLAGIAMVIVPILLLKGFHCG